MDFKIESPNVALIVDYLGTPIVRTGEGTELTLDTNSVNSHTYYTSLAAALAAYDTDFPLLKFGNPFKTRIEESDLTIGTVSDPVIEASVGDAVTLTCQVSHATFTVAFQWHKDGEEIPGATSNNIATASLVEEHYGEYRCEVTVTDNTDDRQVVVARQFEVKAPVAALTSATSIGA